MSANAECPICDGPIQKEVRRESFDYITPKGTVKLVADVPYEICRPCDYEGYGEEGERAKAAAIYNYLERLVPWEISEIRKRLGYSQRRFADILGVGHASLERWETGHNIQSESMNRLILLCSQPHHVSWLEGELVRRKRAAGAESIVIQLDRFRALPKEEMGQLVAKSEKFRLRR